MATPVYALDLAEITSRDAPRVGGKNASLGRLWNALRPLGVGVVDGFATTTAAYQRFLDACGLRERLRAIFSSADGEEPAQLAARAHAAVLETPLPEEVRAALLAAYERLCARLEREPELAVRASVAGQDLPEAAFAGQHETFLNVRGKEPLLRAVQACYASLFTERALACRARLGYAPLEMGLSVGVQPMVRADQGCAGQIFTADTRSGFRDIVTVTGAFGLGELVVHGVVSPDEWMVFKPMLTQGFRPIIGRHRGGKEVMLVYADSSHGTRSEATSHEQRSHFCLSDDEVLKLARWGCLVEEQYTAAAGSLQPIELEWAKDGLSGELVLLQARAETALPLRVRTDREPAPHAAAASELTAQRQASAKVSLVPRTRTQILLNVEELEQAFELAAIPSAGVGLASVGGILSKSIGIHPMAIVRYPKLSDAQAVQELALRLFDEEPHEFFVRRLSEGVARIAAAFYPRPVFVRTSDLKTSEYARLLGGTEFEPLEENPMLGFRGAVRYRDPRYAEGFALECRALERVRKEMGLKNVKLLIPFCRTAEEGEKLLETLAQHGLKQHQDGLEVYVTCELPANAVLAEEFLRIFDGFLICVHNLGQLLLGVHRESESASPLPLECDAALRKTIAQAIAAAHALNKPVGIYSRTPVLDPDFVRWLVAREVTAISLPPEAALQMAFALEDAEDASAV